MTDQEYNRPPTDEEIAALKAWAIENNILMAERERLKTERQAELDKPIVPLPISGTTVSSVKASADASVKDLATQMQAKLDLLGGN
jgi:hypothetical protein